MKNLTVKERVIVDAIAELNREGKQAYGASIHDWIGSNKGMTVSFGDIYVAVERLVEVGYLDAAVWEGGPDRNWRKRVCLTVMTAAAVRKAAAL